MIFDVKIDDYHLPDGRYWHYLASFTERVEEAAAMGYHIDTNGVWTFDAHECEGFFSLRSADGERLLVMKTIDLFVHELIGPGEREATYAQEELALDVAATFGRIILTTNGFVVPPESPRDFWPRRDRSPIGAPTRP